MFMAMSVGVQELTLMHSAALYLLELSVAVIWFFAAVKRGSEGGFRLRIEDRFDSMKIDPRMNNVLSAILALFSYLFAYKITTGLLELFLPFDPASLMFFLTAEPAVAVLIMIFSVLVILSVFYSTWGHRFLEDKLSEAGEFIKQKIWR
jgi:hypothetical protein